MLRLRCAVPVVLAALAASGSASAQSGDTDRQIAQQLFDDGRVLLEARRYAEACPKFAESQRLDPGGGTLVNLAFCHELEGKTATAWSEFRDALGQAVKDDRKDREDLARTHIADLAPKLMRVVVLVPERLAARDPEINLDKSKLPTAAWGTPIPVDPGEHRVSVSIAGARPWSVGVSVSEPGETYTVRLASLESPVPCPQGQMRVQDACVVIPWDGTKSRRTTAFWLTLSGAGALLVTSAITGVVALSANAYVNDNCSSARDFCRVSDAGDAATRAKTFAWISTATLGAGVVAGVVAFVLPREKPATFGGGTVTLGLGTLRITGM
ncbi:MAG: hypothetical protein QOI41_6578 [Myxococcales bacterium]|nr:hypothetical protein [Myxococcales bacterium]